MHTHRQLKPRKNVCGDYNEYILKCTILMAAFKISTLIQRSRGSFPGHPQVPQLRLSDSLWVIPSAVSSVTDCPESQGRGSLMGSHRVEQQQQPSRDRVRTRITSWLRLLASFRTFSTVSSLSLHPWRFLVCHIPRKKEDISDLFARSYLSASKEWHKVFR